MSTTLDGRTALDPDAGQVVTTALRLATTDDTGAAPARTPGHRRADALVEVCRWFLDHQHTNPRGRHRPHVNLVVDADHVHHWEHGGPTRPDNLVLLCSRHHHRAHLPGWHASSG